MAACLSEDLVLEIISWLPIKKVIQCKSLNKNICNCISNPNFAHKRALQWNQEHGVKTLFHFSAYKPKIFSKFDLNDRTIIKPTIFGSTCRSIRIMASCNGLLLLLINNAYYVFNPITGGIAFVMSSYKMENRNLLTGLLELPDLVGLVVDIDMGRTTTTIFKLVQAYYAREQNEVRFKVVTSETAYSITNWSFPCPGFDGFASDYKLTPVYLDGDLHWLGKNGHKILAFNVEKKKIRIINGPGTIIKEIGEDIWFGVARGSLSFVCTLPQEIRILTYDYPNDNWQIVHSYALVLEDISKSVLVFYDGRRLFYQMFKTDVDRQIYMLDESEHKWEKGVMVSEWCDANQIFVPFCPTLAKVSDEYLHTLNSKSAYLVKLVKEDLLSLQRFFRNS